MFKKGNNFAYQHDKELLALVEDGWGDFEYALHSEVGHLIPQYLSWHQRSLWAILFLFFGPLLFIGLGGFFGVTLGGQSPVGFLISVAIIPVSFGILIWTLLRWYKISTEFNKVFNPLIFEKAFDMLGLSGVHTTKESVTETEIINLLDHSELITQSRNRYEIDDMIKTQFHGRSLFMAELKVRHVSGSGKNRRDETLFHGFFAVHDLPRHLEGKTFITTESDRRGYGEVSWSERVFHKRKSPQKTMLEWNDFENKLHVATTDEIEARYILTPDFMEELYGWWKERDGNIRISFLDNRLYVLFPDMKVRIGHSTMSFKEEHLKQYVMTVMRPVWHLQHLMKHAEARLRSL